MDQCGLSLVFLKRNTLRLSYTSLMYKSAIFLPVSKIMVGKKKNISLWQLHRELGHKYLLVENISENAVGF